MDLLAELDKAILSEREGARAYIGASFIGDECSRKIWRRLRGDAEVYDPLSLRRFADGHDVEARIIRWLKKIPDIEVWDVGENGEQFGFTALDGKFQGHYDGVIRIDGILYLLEIKASTKMGTLEKLKEKFPEELCLQKWNEDYYAQGMSYCRKANIDNHLLICTDAGGRNIIIVRTPANHAFADALMDKAKRIADSVEMPQKNGAKTWYKCKMCPFYKDCWE